MPDAERVECAPTAELPRVSQPDASASNLAVDAAAAPMGPILPAVAAAPDGSALQDDSCPSGHGMHEPGSKRVKAEGAAASQPAGLPPRPCSSQNTASAGAPRAGATHSGLRAPASGDARSGGAAGDANPPGAATGPGTGHGTGNAAVALPADLDFPATIESLQQQAGGLGAALRQEVLLHSSLAAAGTRREAMPSSAEVRMRCVCTWMGCPQRRGVGGRWPRVGATGATRLDALAPARFTSSRPVRHRTCAQQARSSSAVRRYEGTIIPVALLKPLLIRTCHHPCPHAPTTPFLPADLRVA